MGAVYRLRPEQKPGASHLESADHQPSMTRFGPLNILGVIGKARRYEDLLTHSEEKRRAANG